MSISVKLLIPSIVLFISGLLFVFPAFAHDGEVHDEAETVSQVELMEQVIALLQQLLVLLAEKADAVPADSMTTPVSVNVTVEEHDGKVHVHVYETGKAEVKFFLEDVVLTAHDAIIDAIVAKTGIARSVIAAGTTFPAENDDDHSHHDIDGIHIMADGTVMLGNGTPVTDATVTADGKIKMADGTIVEPEFDLR